jgi:hypothetical protein
MHHPYPLTEIRRRLSVMTRWIAAGQFTRAQAPVLPAANDMPPTARSHDRALSLLIGLSAAV